jgi:hypothetical protein
VRSLPQRHWDEQWPACVSQDLAVGVTLRCFAGHAQSGKQDRVANEQSVGHSEGGLIACRPASYQVPLHVCLNRLVASVEVTPFDNGRSRSDTV